MPQFTNNYEFEPMDVDGDSDLDLATINDGQSFGEHLFRNDRGTFTRRDRRVVARSGQSGL